MQKLGGGHGFTKIDLVDAYNQIMLAPESQRRLALSTHRGVLLQTQLPFGISSAQGYFQEIMNQLTRDLQGVVVYMDDILVSGATASEHLQNLRSLLERLQDKGLRCCLEKCIFAQSSVEYLGHILSQQGIAKGSKVDAVKMMPPPETVSGLCSFFGSVQFYGKFLPNLASVTEPLHHLTKKDVPWKWGMEEQAAFRSSKTCCVTTPFWCILILPFPLGHPAMHQRLVWEPFSSTGTVTAVSAQMPTLQRPLQAPSVDTARFRKRHWPSSSPSTSSTSFLYGRTFILVTDHKPIIALFRPMWTLMLSQYNYMIEYRKTSDHGNADALSHLLAGPDANFDGEEGDADVDTVCIIKAVSLQLNPTEPGTLAKESAKDTVIANVMRYTREGWPPKGASNAKTCEMVQWNFFRKLAVSLSTTHGCLLYGSSVVIRLSLRPQVEIMDLCHRCTALRRAPE